MNWQNQIDRELDRIATASEWERGPVAFSVAAEHGDLHCELVAVDTMGCAFHRLRFRTGALARTRIDHLRRLGQVLTERLSYLLEPITNLELDQEGFSLQLRSCPPEQDDSGRRYYELTARRDEGICLCRYAKQPGQPRRIVPATVTREVLRRLASDMDAAVASLGEQV